MFQSQKHYFTVSIAVKFGIDKAIIIEYIHYWMEENMERPKMRRITRKVFPQL